MGINTTKILKLFCFLFYLGLFVLGAINYTGSKLLYLIFSITFFCMLIVGVYKQESYGYMFLAIFIWLGFWLKFTVHTILGTAYIEPIGDFTPSPENLNNVLFIALFASLGITLARFVPLFIPTSKLRRTINNCPVPQWYPYFSQWLWLGLWIVIVLVPVANIVLGIAQTGLVSKINLPWPLTAVMSWIFSNGIFMCVMTLLSWDLASGKKPFQGIYSIIAESLFSSVSLLSRSTFILHALPIIAISFKKGGDFLTNIPRRKFYMVICVWLMAFVFSFILVNTMRIHYFSPDSQVFRFEASEAVKKVSSMAVYRWMGGERYSLFDAWVGGEGIMAVDRWIGVEALMTVYSSPMKGRKLFLDAVFENRAHNKMGFYQSVCKKSYQGVDIAKFNFGSVPGVTAFFYYSGSFMTVLAGLFFVALILRFSEELIYFFTSNLFLCSFYGMTFANIFAQFGMAPRQIFWQFLMMAGVMLFIWMVQRDFNLRSSLTRKF
jgi:hypothetical protein